MTFAHSAEVVSLKRKLEELEAKLDAIERQAEDKHEYVLAQINGRLKAENAELRKAVKDVWLSWHSWLDDPSEHTLQCVNEGMSAAGELIPPPQEQKG